MLNESSEINKKLLRNQQVLKVSAREKTLIKLIKVQMKIITDCQIEQFQTLCSNFFRKNQNII